MSTVITKLIPKSVNLEGGGGSFGSVTQSDVAAALTSLDPLQQALIDCYHLGNMSYKQYLIEQAANELAIVKIPHHIIEKMAPVLIDDFLDNVCKSCNGTKFNREAKECGSCGGTGKKGYTASTLKDLLGVSNGTLFRRYIQKYRLILHRFDYMCNAAERDIRNKLG